MDTNKKEAEKRAKVYATKPTKLPKVWYTYDLKFRSYQDGYIDCAEKKDKEMRELAEHVIRFSDAYKSVKGRLPAALISLRLKADQALKDK